MGGLHLELGSERLILLIALYDLTRKAQFGIIDKIEWRDLGRSRMGVRTAMFIPLGRVDRDQHQ